MARRFNPDNNYGYHTTEMITMINTAKDGLQDQLRENDRVREEENVQTAEANPSVKKFSKEQNDLKMKELQEYASNKALDQYHLNLHVLDLNYNSTYTEMIKAYRSMARKFHPDNNYGYHTTEMMKMINTARYGLQD